MVSELPSEYQVGHKTTPFGIVIEVELLDSELTEFSGSYKFSLYLEEGFPFHAPKLFCETVSNFPSVADGRDLFSEITREQWKPNITCVDVIQLLPGFLKKLKTLSSEEVQNLGNFKLGSYMHLSLWEHKPNMGKFLCTHLDKPNSRIVLAVTHTLILQLEVHPEHPDIGYLFSWATLQSLATIKRSKSDVQKLTFDWKAIGENPPYSQELYMPESSACISLITENLQKLGSIVNREGALISEEEVKPQSYQKVNISDILESITVYESNLEQHMSVEIVNSLMSLYQQAIEYFSAINDPQYDLFLDRMHSLLSNDLVQTVLESQTDKHSEKKPQEPTFEIGEEELQAPQEEPQEPTFEIGEEELQASQEEPQEPLQEEPVFGEKEPPQEEEKTSETLQSSSNEEDSQDQTQDQTQDPSHKNLE